MSADNFQKKTSGILATLVIGLIVVSFMFSGYDSLKRGSPETVAKIGDQSISIREYRQEYERQINFYRQMYGGEISSKQIESLKIKDQVLKNLVNQKLVLKLADQIGINPSEREIREAIKEELKALGKDRNIPFFNEQGQFDVELYKNLLARNQLTPTAFEADMSNQIKRKLLQTMFQNFPISNEYINDILKFKAEKFNSDVVQITKTALYKYVTVSDKEIETYLANNENKAKVESLFKDRKPELDQKEQVKARHILWRTTPENETEIKKKVDETAKLITAANFKEMADKHTEDPSGKGKGGDLNWFSRGQMVKEFEDVAFMQKVGTVSFPVKSNFGYHLILVEDKKDAKEALIADHEKNLARELIQKGKNEDIKALAQEIKVKVEQMLRDDKQDALKELKKKYDIEFHSNVSINKYDGASGNVFLTSEQMKKITTQDKAKREVLIFDDAAKTTIIRLSKNLEEKETKTEQDPAATEKSGLANVLSQKALQDIVKDMEENTKLKIYATL